MPIKNTTRSIIEDFAGQFFGDRSAKRAAQVVPGTLTTLRLLRIYPTALFTSKNPAELDDCDWQTRIDTAAHFTNNF
jgi:hypothetical protein